MSNALCRVHSMFLFSDRSGSSALGPVHSLFFSSDRVGSSLRVFYQLSHQNRQIKHPVLTNKGRDPSLPLLWKQTYTNTASYGQWRTSPPPHCMRRCFRFLFWSADWVGQRGALYVFRLPAAWRKYMASAKLIPGFIFGKSVAWLYVCACVITMGWISAVSLFQDLQRKFSLIPFPRGAGLDPDLEWRRIPITSLSQNGSW